MNLKANQFTYNMLRFNEKNKETKKPSNMKKLKMLLCAKICLKRKYKKFWCVYLIYNIFTKYVPSKELT